MEIKEGTKLEIEIISKGRKGDGIGKYNGLIIIVPNTELKQKYLIEITTITEKYAFAIMLERL